MRVDLKKLRRKATDFQFSSWNKQPIAAILPAYYEWMHTVNCKIADAIDGTHLYGVQHSDGRMEFWIYRTGGHYERVSAPSKALTAIADDPNVNVMVSDDTEARAILRALGLLNKFTERGNLPGPGLQLLAHDGLRTHWLAVIFVHGLPNKRDNGFLVHLLPRSRFNDPDASQAFITNVKAEYERRGIRVIVHS
jgi:hypothetical protein